MPVRPPPGRTRALPPWRRLRRVRPVEVPADAPGPVAPHPRHRYVGSVGGAYVAVLATAPADPTGRLTQRSKVSRPQHSPEEIQALTITRVRGGSAGGSTPFMPSIWLESAVSGTITPNAAVANFFRYGAVAAVALASPIGGTNGAVIDVQVNAVTADRVLTLPDGLGALTIAAGSTWWGHLSYDSVRAEWILYTADSSGGGSGGSGGSPSGVAGGVLSGSYPSPGFAVDMATQAELNSVQTTLQSASDSLTTRVTAVETPVVNPQTGTTYTLVIADAGKVVERNSASANTTTIPTNASVAFPVGTVLEVFQYGAGTSSVVAAATVSILPGPSPVVVSSRYQSLSLRKRATNEWIVT